MSSRFAIAITLAFLAVPSFHVNLVAAAPPTNAKHEAMTLEEFMAARPDAKVPPTPASPDRTLSVYVIVAGNGAGDSAYQMECAPDATVGSVLRKAIYPHPIDFASVQIAVHRPRHQVNDDLTVATDEEDLRVEWDSKANQPTAKTNHHLQPNDRIIVTLPPAPVAVVPTPIVAGAAPALHADPTPAAPSQVRFDVVVVEDVCDSFTEFEQLRSQMIMLSDTATIQGTLRILEKQNLVRRVADPKLLVVTGQEATIQIGNESPNKDEPWQGLKAKMGARELGGGLAVEFSFKNTAGRQTSEVRTSLIVPHGQTVVIKTSGQLLETANGDDATKQKVEHAVYVVLTPEILK